VRPAYPESGVVGCRWTMDVPRNRPNPTNLSRRTQMSKAFAWFLPSTVWRAGLLAAALMCAGSHAQGREDDSEAARVRDFIDEQVGGLHNLQVPARNEDIPLPKQADGTVNPRYKTTEAKRFLGKMLFHDPVRS